MKKLFFVSIVIAVVLCSCASNILAPGQYFFQAMGNKNCQVVTIKNNLTKNHRISFELYDDSSISGIAELGNVPSSLIDAKIRQNKSFTRIKGIIPYYQNNSSDMSIAVIGNGLVLFSDKDIEDAYTRFALSREEIINHQDALKMLSYSYSLYSENIESFSKIVAGTNDLENFDFFMVSESEEKASKFLSLVKAKEIEKYRIEGVKPDYSDLSARIKATGNELELKNITELPIEFDFSEMIDQIYLLLGDGYGI